MKPITALLAGIALTGGAALLSAAPAHAAPMQTGTPARFSTLFKPDVPVIELQEALDANGAKLDIDGMWGPRTKAALKHYQRDHGLVASGELTSPTRASLGLLG